MGRWMTWSGDVLGRYPRLSTKTGSMDCETAYVAPAEAEVEGRLSSRFSAPFSNNNQTAIDLGIDIAFYRNMKYDDPKKASTMAKDINDRIQALLDGTAVMVTTSGDQVSMVSGAAWSSTEDYVPIFNLDGPLDWELDPDQLDDIDAERS